MARVEAEPVQDDGGTPRVRLRIDGTDAEGRAGDERSLTLTLSVKEAMAVRDALNRALNDLGLPDQD